MYFRLFKHRWRAKNFPFTIFDSMHASERTWLLPDYEWRIVFFFRVVANLPLWSSFLPLFLFSARNYHQTCTNPPIHYHRQVKRNFIRSVHFMFCLNWLVNRKWRYRWSDRGPKVSRCDVTQPSDRRPIKDATLIPRTLSKSSQNASTMFVEL